ncbi:ubiquitin-specific protease ubp2, partial [Rhizoclosmatium hyalinum]
EQHMAEHYERMGCLSNSTDEKIQWAFLKQLDCDIQNKSLYLDSLIAIASSRPNSFSLPEFIAMERTKRTIHTTSDLVTAYNLFNLPAPSSDKPEKYPAHILTTLFQSKAEEQPNLLDELRAGLKIVGEDQGCEDAIELFLETGYAPMGSTNSLVGFGAADPNKPIGLENFGNICYLNALIQFYVTIKPLRESVLHHVPDLSHWPRPKNPERFLQLLKDLFLRLSERGGETVSVAVGRDLAVAVLGGMVISSPSKQSQKMVGEVEVDAMEIDGESKKVDSKDLLLNVQQDVGEFMEVFLDMAEKGFANFGDSERANTIKRLFFGKTIETLKYLDASGAPKTLIREDEFMNLMIGVAHDLYTSLDS